MLPKGEGPEAHGGDLVELNCVYIVHKPIDVTLTFLMLLYSNSFITLQ